MHLVLMQAMSRILDEWVSVTHSHTLVLEESMVVEGVFESTTREPGEVP